MNRITIRLLTLLPFLTLAIFLTSCDAVLTTNHITDATTDLLQDKLTGAWQADDGVIQIKFDEGGTGHLASLEWKEEQFEMSQSRFQALEVEGTTILTVESPDENDDGFILAAVRQAENNEMHAFRPRINVFAKLVETDQLEGKVEKGKHTTRVIIDDAGKIVSNTPLEKLFNFENKMVFKRIIPLENEN
ncbi:MAG: hypothetical protein L7T84_13905 [Akkermansiaceae bacterium]|nr:hypothetical protein [Akkermansiaceae bacterium]